MASSVKGRSAGDKLSGKLKTAPTPAQKRYLKLAEGQPGGKLPLFDDRGQRISPRTIRACVDAGWAEPWARNPIEPNWLVCKLTQEGARLVQSDRSSSPRKVDPQSVNMQEVARE